LLTGTVLAVAITWPLAARLDHVAVRGRDEAFTVWELGWMGHALRTHPLDLYDTNAFWPLQNSLAFADAMIGLAPLGALVDGPSATLTVYNLLFIGTYAFAFVGAYVLARELGAQPAAAAVAGAAFAFAPFRLAQASHLHVLASGGIPLTLFLLARGYRTARRGLVLAGWLVAAWQVTLGFTLGLQLLYLLAGLACVAGVFWLRTGQPRLARRVMSVSAIGIGVLLVVSALQARPFLEVADTYPDARRSAFEISSLSPVPKGFLAAPKENLVWGDVTERFRRDLRAPAEQILFPGVAVLALAIVGAVAARVPRLLRLGLAAGTLAAATLATGFHISVGRLSYLFPYRWLYELAPGWNGVRTPGRLWTLVELGLALLAALGTQRLSDAVRPASGRFALCGVALAAVVLEGAGQPTYTDLPPPPLGQRALGGPQLHLPVSEYDSLYQYWSTLRYPDLVNGYVGFRIPQLRRVYAVAMRFPDEQAVNEFRHRGIKYVVFHPELGVGTPWAGLSRRPIPRGVARERRPGVVVFKIGR
jgi:hypothetical protein